MGKERKKNKLLAVVLFLFAFSGLTLVIGKINQAFNYSSWKPIPYTTAYIGGLKFCGWVGLVMLIVVLILCGIAILEK